jgi:FkbM family methyltransferase
MTLNRKIIPYSIENSIKRLLYRHSLASSQLGQDYWIYGEVFAEKRNGYFLDIGAHDGVTLSNTYILESRYKWTGICIEANPITFSHLKKNRCSLCLNYCLDHSEGEVNFILAGTVGGIVDQDVDNKVSDATSDKVIKLKTRTLISVLEDYNVPGIIDYLSIDVEGAEERILSGFDFQKYTFKSITIERPTKLLRDLFNVQGYILIKEIPETDCFYIHKDFFQEYLTNIDQFYRKKRLIIRYW